MNRQQNDLTVELAGGLWQLSGLFPEQLGRLREALVPGSESPLPNTVAWEWVDEATDWNPLETDEEFDISFDYDESAFIVRGLRFQALVTLEPEINARIRVLKSAALFTEFIFENLMRILVSYRATAQGGLLLHSACFTNGRKTWLLFGHSGAGKSTCSSFAASAGMQILSDDMNVIFPENGGWNVRRVPFCGTCEKEYTGPASMSLTEVCHLRQSGHNSLEPLTAATGVSLLVASAAFLNEDPWRADRLLDNCTKLLQYVPVQALYFRRDPEFISLLTEQDDSKAVA